MKADKKTVMKKLNIASGQLEGIKRLIASDAYCLDISNQILATIALLKNANLEILSAHLEHCIVDSSKEELLTKINEINDLLKRIS
ncbi:MAG TPA: metal-sensing transcriptional repressor [Bacilli bacterium]|nr:metal-sensing transcriptional repressor [Bacilli bacterium]